jgi:excisionase family DNA binding protein
MEYITAREAAELWGISKRRVQALLEDNRIPTATRLGNVWAIPEDVSKPLDGRTKTAKQVKND